jgi:hypothetical protein
LTVGDFVIGMVVGAILVLFIIFLPPGDEPLE